MTLVLVSLAIVPAACAIVYFWVVAQQDEKVREQAEITAIARLVVHDQSQWITSANAMLSTVASGPSVRRTDMREICNAFLTNLQRSSPQFTSIRFVDLAGSLQCQASPPLAAVGVLTPSPALDGPSVAVAAALGSQPETPPATVQFRREVRNDEGAVVGTALVDLDLQYVRRQLDLFRLNRNVRIIVNSSSGQVISASKDAMTDMAAFLPGGPAHASAASQLEGSNWIVASEEMTGNTGDRWHVLVGATVKDALTPLQSQLTQQVATLGIATLAGLMLALLFARFFLEKPIVRIIEHMRRASTSEEGGFQSISAAAEFDELQAVFASLIADLHAKHNQLKTAQNITKVGFFELDLEKRVSTAPPETYAILGLDPAQGPIPLVRYQSLIHPEDQAHVLVRRGEALAGGRPFHVQHRIVRDDGSLRWLNSYGFVNRDPHGVPRSYYGAIQDITDLKEAEHQALATEKRFRLLVEHSLDGVLQAAQDGRLISANPAAHRILALSPSNMTQLGAADIFDFSDPRVASFLVARERDGHAASYVRMSRRDGATFEAEVSGSVYRDTDDMPCTSLVVRDITERLAQEKSIHDLAYFDVLTGLPNRRCLVERINAYLQGEVGQGQIGLVIFVDLDNFKNVNDALGHATGDALLKLVAARLRLLVRSEDIVARLGGDEFVLAIPGLSSDPVTAATKARTLTEQVRSALTEPFEIDGHPYMPSSSIGVTLMTDRYQTVDDLLREADTAMYRAKKTGRNRVVFFESEMQAAVKRRLEIEHALTEAIDTDQLFMVMQPQVDPSGDVDGCELLMRWIHPVHGAVAPSDFIPVAEESGLILRLGDWVLQEACRTIRKLRDAGFKMPVSINVSPSQFKQTDFVQRVQKIIWAAGVMPSSLIFEITEGLLIESFDDVIGRMNELIALGIRFSIDDFGTGYSSLSYLHRLPLYELKIDRSFVKEIPGTPGPAALVQSILSMSAHLGLRVVAEGVETVDQANFLVQHGCQRMQGYLFARPTPVDQWLASQRKIA